MYVCSYTLSVRKDEEANYILKTRASGRCTFWVYSFGIMCSWSAVPGDMTVVKGCTSAFGCNSSKNHTCKRKPLHDQVSKFLSMLILIISLIDLYLCVYIYTYICHVNR